MHNLLYLSATLVVIFLFVLILKALDAGVKYDKAKKKIDKNHKGKYTILFAGTGAMAMIPFPIKDDNPKLKAQVKKYNSLTKTFWIVTAVGILIMVLLFTV